jgi:hypothetical protein
MKKKPIECWAIIYEDEKYLPDIFHSRKDARSCKSAFKGRVAKVIIKEKK